MQCLAGTQHARTLLCCVLSTLQTVAETDQNICIKSGQPAACTRLPCRTPPSRPEPCSQPGHARAPQPSQQLPQAMHAAAGAPRSPSHVVPPGASQVTHAPQVQGGGLAPATPLWAEGWRGPRDGGQGTGGWHELRQSHAGNAPPSCAAQPAGVPARPALLLSLPCPAPPRPALPCLPAATCHHHLPCLPPTAASAAPS